MFSVFIAFLIGCIIGGAVGLFAAACCFVGGDIYDD